MSERNDCSREGSQIHSDRIHFPERYTDYLRDQLKEHRISLNALARESGIDRSQVARWINTRVQPSWKSVIRMERALDSLIPQQSNELGDPPRKIRHYTNVELVSGPSDGESLYVRVEIPAEVDVETLDMDGRPITAVYRRVSRDIQRVVAYPESDDASKAVKDLAVAFSGVDPVKYVWLAEPLADASNPDRGW